MSDNITNQLIAKMQNSPPNAPQQVINLNKILTKGGKRRRKNKRKSKKILLGGNTKVAVNDIPNTVVSPGIKEMYKDVNQARLTNLVQSITDGGSRRIKSRRIKSRRKRRRRSI